ncbi:MAG: hypothetical protein ACR2QC_05910, partial [Gammaproteobacteria bacterium]
RYCPQKQKNRHSGESRNLFNPIPAKAGISAPKGANCRRRRTNVQLPAALRRRRFLPSQEWDGGRGGIRWRRAKIAGAEREFSGGRRKLRSGAEIRRAAAKSGRRGEKK